jgi:hypothetical protein
MLLHVFGWGAVALGVISEIVAILSMRRLSKASFELRPSDSDYQASRADIRHGELIATFNLIAGVLFLILGRLLFMQ